MSHHAQSTPALSPSTDGRPRASLALALVAALSTLVSHAAAAAPPGACITKAGTATGITKDFADYEALLIIKQMTGNWPFESDSIKVEQSKCKAESGMWTCTVKAKVCKKG